MENVDNTQRIDIKQTKSGESDNVFQNAMVSVLDDADDLFMEEEVVSGCSLTASWGN